MVAKYEAWRYREQKWLPTTSGEKPTSTNDHSQEVAISSRPLPSIRRGTCLSGNVHHRSCVVKLSSRNLLRNCSLLNQTWVQCCHQRTLGDKPTFLRRRAQQATPFHYQQCCPIKAALLKGLLAVSNSPQLTRQQRSRGPLKSLGREKRRRRQ